MAGTDGRFAHRAMAYALLAAAMVAAATLIAVWGTAFVSGDPLGYAERLATHSLGDAMLNPPANKYLIAAPLALYKGLFEVFGLDSFTPYRVAGIVLVLLCSGLLFELLRRRVGNLAAVPPAVLMLFFGPGWSVVLTPDRIPSQIALAAGLAMILALEQEDLRGDVIGSVLLAVALASHPVGIAFAAVAAVMILLRLPPERFERLWVVAVPGALFAIWWFLIRTPNTGSDPPTPGDLISFAADSWAALVAAVSGLFGVLDSPAFETTLGWVAAALLLVVIAIGVARYWWRLPPLFWAAAAGLVVLLVATRLSPAGFTRIPDEPRYLYPEAFLLLLALGGLAAGARPHRWVIWGVSGLLVLSLWPSIDLLDSEGENLRAASDRARARLAALEIAGENAVPGYQPSNYLPTQPEYEAATEAYGRLGFTPEELQSQDAPIRLEADIALVGALGLSLDSSSKSQPPPGPSPELILGDDGGDAPEGCIETTSNHAEVELRSPKTWISSDGLEDAGLNLGRFGDQAFVALEPPSGAEAAGLSIPPDDVEVPWRLGIDSAAPVTVCGAKLLRPGKPAKPPKEEGLDAEEVNLQPGDLPADWELTTSSEVSVIGQLLECVENSADTSSRSLVAGTSVVPYSRTVVADVTVFDEPADAQDAFKALTGPDGTECLRSVLGGQTEVSGALQRISLPSSLGDSAAGFRYALRTEGGSSETVARGAAVLFSRDTALVLLSEVDSTDQPVPLGLLLSAAEAVSGRLGG